MTAMKKKAEARDAGPIKDEDFVPWNGVTLNRCLAIAAIAALLSVGFQVLQEAVDTDDLEDAEKDVWTPPEASDQPSEPWFFEGWFGSSTSDSPVTEELETTDNTEPNISVVEDPELPKVEKEIETEEESIKQETVLPEKIDNTKEKQKLTEQWGLKSKGKYMESKGNKIRTAAEEGPRKENFPFNLAKKPKDSPKPYPEKKEKLYKDEKYHKKYEEKKYEHPKKQENEKSPERERQEKNKYFKQDRGKKDDKDYKGYKEHHYEKDYKKKYDPRHHG